MFGPFFVILFAGKNPAQNSYLLVHFIGNYAFSCKKKGIFVALTPNYEHKH